MVVILRKGGGQEEKKKLGITARGVSLTMWYTGVIVVDEVTWLAPSTVPGPLTVDFTWSIPATGHIPTYATAS